MSIPAAPKGEEYAYDFQYAIFIKETENITIILDTYLYQPVYSPFIKGKAIYLAAEDVRRIYAPYLDFKKDDKQVSLKYAHPLKNTKEISLAIEDVIIENGITYIDIFSTMCGSMNREGEQDENIAIIAIDSDAPVSETFPSRFKLKALKDRLHIKFYGYQDYSLWNEEARRIIPYRMYIPFSYNPDTPNKTLVCFHGGDSNQNYMFNHTSHEISRYAERYGYILLSLCSYRKFTFFGASKLPPGYCSISPSTPNPCGLTDNEKQWCDIAEKSVLLQIQDAMNRYNIDSKNMYALGNSGGSMGIFQQVSCIESPFFRAAVCSGGMTTATFLDTDNLKSKKTAFLLLISSEDEFDAQYTFREGYPYLLKKGVPVEYKVVGGGSHLTGWTKALAEIFNYFERCHSEMSC